MRRAVINEMTLEIEIIIIMDMRIHMRRQEAREGEKNKLCFWSFHFPLLFALFL